MTPRERGKQDGEADARAAWSGLTWKRSDRHLPANHLDRLDYLQGHAAGFAEYNYGMAEHITREVTEVAR